MKSGAADRPTRPTGCRPRPLSNAAALSGVGLFGFFVVIALVAPWSRHSIQSLQNAEVRLTAPSPAHPFGTDNFGRDILSRVIWGARIDLQIAILGVVFPFLLGTAIGTVAGYFGGSSTPFSCGSSTSSSPSRSSC